MTAAPVSSDIEPRRVLDAIGYGDASEPVAVAGGWETVLWRFATPDGGEHALRLYVLPRAEQTAWRERVAMETCAAAGLETPRIEAAGTYDGMPAIVQTWCPGDSLLARIEKKPWQMLRLGRHFGRLHARLHTIPAPAEFAAGAPDDWLARVLPRHAHLAERLRSNGTASGTLVHLDYHPLNVIVDGAQASIIDWAYSAAGDVRADLALTAVALEIAPAPPSRLKPLLAITRKLATRSWRAGYRDVAGSMPDYRPFLGWACAFRYRVTDATLGRPGVWATPDDLATLQRHIDRWSEFR
jgi:aminoglycoside phosphotransferase (APT) family kinase protein